VTATFEKGPRYETSTREGEGPRPSIRGLAPNERGEGATSSMTEYRIRCSGEGKRHEPHVYSIDREEFLMLQRWTKESGCRPFVVEERSVGMWVRSGQQKMEAAI
jgi:hypothetical protein